jgi:hypothetical protein
VFASVTSSHFDSFFVYKNVKTVQASEVKERFLRPYRQACEKMAAKYKAEKKVSFTPKHKISSNLFLSQSSVHIPIYFHFFRKSIDLYVID